MVSDDPAWLGGPSFAVKEIMFDEFDQDGCSMAADDSNRASPGSI